jgi:selenocysteine lyase/cysteine desulfurase
VETQRHLFDIPPDVAYFNAAYNGPQLRASTQALEQAVRNKALPWSRNEASFFEDAETIRALAADTFGGDADGYAIVPSATYGVTTAARILEPMLKRGDRIIGIKEDFPAVWLPWQRAAAHTGSELVQVSLESGAAREDRLIGEIERGARIVSLSTVRWTDGTLHDLVRIAQAARSVGACLVLDATQSFGALQFDFERIRPDFLVSAGYKWLLCPYGFGLLHVSAEWRNSRPLEESWLAREASESFANLVRPRSSYRPGSRRFDVSETCVETILAGVIPAFRQIARWGVSNIENHLVKLTGRIHSQLPASLQNLGTEGDHRHILGFNLPEGLSQQISTELASRKIYASVRGHSLRIAPYLHVTEDDLTRLTEALGQVVRKYL